MCGIYGQWDLDHRPLDLAAVRQATTLLRHRGPDDEGYLVADTRRAQYRACAGHDTTPSLRLPPLAASAGDVPDLAFGFRRLAIVDLSAAGHQPMANADERLWIVFNGEVYNYRELRRELAQLGHTFRSDTDTEVILAAYQAWGTACLHRFNGMWALAIWDSRTGHLFLARDRFGVKPLHYVVRDRRFAFASEIKALVGGGAASARPDDAAVYAYLHEGHLPSPQGSGTFFADVRALPPGCLMQVTRGGVHVERWYELPLAAAERPRPRAEIVEEFGRLFTDAVSVRLRSDVPVGTCLSGGLDSSSIVGVVSKLVAAGGDAGLAVGDRQKTFSAVYETAGRYNERPFAELVLQATGAEGNFVVPTAEWLQRDLARLAWHQDEPFGSTSIFAQWCVMSAVRARGVTVLLDGQGADEILAGYRPYDILAADLLRRGRVGRALSAAREAGQTTGMPMARVLGRALVRQLPDRYLRRLRVARAARATVGLRPELVSAHAHDTRYEPVNRGLHAYLRELLLETSLPHLLRYEDRNSMAFSVEGRVPFLDYRLVDFALTEAFASCIHDGWTKWVLRESMRGVVPDRIVWRRDKVGFETPEGDWLRTLLNGGTTLRPDSPISQYLDMNAAGAEIASWLRGDGGDGRRIWRWIGTDLWLRRFAAGAVHEAAA